MGTTFSRVTSGTSVAPSLFWLVTITVFAVSIYRSWKKKEAPWALVLICTAAGAVALIPVPRQVWMNRELGLVGLLGIILLLIQTGKEPKAKSLLRAAIYLVPLLLGVGCALYDGRAGKGISFLDLRPTEVAFRVGEGELVIDAISRTHVIVSDDASTLVSSNGYEDLMLDDFFRDDRGQYISGRDVTIRVQGWIQTHSHAPTPDRAVPDPSLGTPGPHRGQGSSKAGRPLFR